MLRSLTVTLLATMGTAYASPELLQEVEKTKKVHQITNSLSTLEYTLPNGLKVFLTENNRAPNVQVGHWVKAGSLHEKEGISGIAHLFEHMMFRPLKAGELSFPQAIRELGGDYDASTRFESTWYTSTVPAENLKPLLKMEAARFKGMTVTKEILDIERGAVRSEYSVKIDSNVILNLWNALYQQGYKGHPFGWFIMGYPADLGKITAEDCNAFFKKYYNPNNTGLFLTGRFKAADVLPDILENYRDWQKGQDSTLPAQNLDKTEAVTGEGTLASAGKTVMFGFRTPYFSQENIGVQSLAGQILFDSAKGLVKERLVDNTKLVQGFGEFNFAYDNGMLKGQLISTDSVDLNRMKSEILKFNDDLRKMDNTTFEAHKQALYIETGETLQLNESIAYGVALSWGKYGTPAALRRFTMGPVNVSKKEVQAFFDRYFVKDNLVFVSSKSQTAGRN